MLLLEWCSLCNSKPADGKLTLRERESGDEITVPACESCVNELDWSKP